MANLNIEKQNKIETREKYIKVPTCEEICNGKTSLNWLDPVEVEESIEIPVISKNDLDYCILGPHVEELS